MSADHPLSPHTFPQWLALLGVVAAFGGKLLVADEPDAAAAANAAEASQQYQRQEVAELNEAEAKAALVELDAEIERLENLAQSAPDKTNADAVRERAVALKKQRDELQENFSQSRFDLLRADARRTWNEFKGWVRSKTGAEDSADGVADTADYRPMPHTAGAPVATHRDSAYRQAQEDAEARAGGAEHQAAAAQDRAEARNRAIEEVAREQRKIALQKIDDVLAELRRTESTSRDTSRTGPRQAEAFAGRRRELEHNFNERDYQALLHDLRDAAERVPQAAE